VIYGVTDLTTFILGTVFIVLLPGPNSLYVMTLASRHGIGAGYRASCGIFVGDTILMVLAATGAASVLYASAAIFTALKFAGAAYLAWLGFGLIRLSKTESPTATQSMRQPFRTALTISLLNPKAIMFFISFFIQFVDPSYPYPALSFLVLGIIVQICSALYLSALIFGGVHLQEKFSARPWLVAGSTTVVGLLFIGFAIRLAS
jgi:leucine efflux protein